MLTATTTHTTLLARLGEGADSLAWSEFCARYGDLIRGFALRRGLQPADADDILQDVLVKLTRSMAGFQYDPRKGRFRSYLKTVVIHAIFDKLNQAAGQKPVENIDDCSRIGPDDVDADEVWEVEWRRYHLRSAMRIVQMEFNDRDLAAFQGYAIDGRDARAIAEELGMSLDQIYQAKSQILRRVSEVVRQQVDDEG